MLPKFLYFIHWLYYLLQLRIPLKAPPLKRILDAIPPVHSCDHATSHHTIPCETTTAYDLDNSHLDFI